MLENATSLNAIAVFEEACNAYGTPYSVLTDHGARFYAMESAKKDSKGYTGFERHVMKNGTRHILTRVGHMQTNGKIERLHDEIQHKLHEFESIMMRKSDPMYLFMRWYNYDRPHMSLNDGETPAEAFERKMAPKGERVIDEQTGEGYDVG